MESKLISVIVPVFKVEKYLDECVRSIVNQTYRNLEIILVDDGSPDRCPEICNEWARRDSRIKVIHKKNGGLSSARNAGLDIAKGDYLGFVDSDDYIANNMYDSLIKSLMKSECKVACCYYARSYTESVQKVEEKEECTYDTRKCIDSFFNGQDISGSVCDKLYSAELFTGIRFPEGETNEDYVVFIPLAVRAKEIVHIGKQFYFYRVNEGSITHSAWKTNADIVLKHLNEIAEQIERFALAENNRAFVYFCAKSAYSTALHLDKHYEHINEKAKHNHKEYIRIMRRHCGMVMFSKHMKLKDKILYLMVVTRMLRPIYKVLGRL